MGEHYKSIFLSVIILADKFLFVEMNKLFSGTSVAPVPLFFLPHDLIHDSLEFVVEFLVVYRFG